MRTRKKHSFNSCQAIYILARSECFGIQCIKQLILISSISEAICGTTTRDLTEKKLLHTKKLVLDHMFTSIQLRCLYSHLHRLG
jgi:hypothetical protein